MNTYSYVKENPLRFFDPVGLVEYNEYGLAYSEYAPNVLVAPELSNTLSYIESIPTGQSLLKKLSESGGEFNIYLETSCIAESESGKGRSYINPKFNPGIVTADGIQRIPSYVVMLHELAHLLTGPTGDKNGPERPRNKNSPTYKEEYAAWEMYNVVTPWENSAREELGLPERIKYFSNVPPTCECE